MPLLAKLVSLLFGGVASFIALFWAKKISVTVLAVAAFALAIAALMVTFNALVAPMVALMSAPNTGNFLALPFRLLLALALPAWLPVGALALFTN